MALNSIFLVSENNLELFFQPKQNHTIGCVILPTLKWVSCHVFCPADQESCHLAKHCFQNLKEFTEFWIQGSGEYLEIVGRTFAVTWCARVRPSQVQIRTDESDLRVNQSKNFVQHSRHIRCIKIFVLIFSFFAVLKFVLCIFKNMLASLNC
jgi:hypothetical protein